LRIAITPCAANVVASSIVRSSKGSIFDRHSAIVRDHRHAEHRVEAAEPARLLPLVPRVHRGVVDLHGLALQAHAPDERAGARVHRVLRDVAAILRIAAERRCDAVGIAVEPVHHARVGGAQPDCVAQDGLEDEADLRRRAADRVQHLARRDLLFGRLSEVPSQPLDPIFERFAVRLGNRRTVHSGTSA
jgi:hypothetical protein